MSAPLDLYVLCAGGHARVMIDILRRMGRVVTALTDDNPIHHGTTIDEVPVIGNRDKVLDRAPDDVLLVNALGNMPRRGNAGLALRRTFFGFFKDKGYRFETVISPEAFISSRAALNEGVQVITGAIVHPGAQVGVNVIINTGAQLDHDCRVGDHSHIAPGAILCGNVTVGEDCHIGAGAVIVPGITVGNGAVVAAGAVVVADVAAGATVMGMAARVPGVPPGVSPGAAGGRS